MIIASHVKRGLLEMSAAGIYRARAGHFASDGFSRLDMAIEWLREHGLVVQGRSIIKIVSAPREQDDDAEIMAGFAADGVGRARGKR